MVSFSGLCEELGCPLGNPRDRWSGYNEKKKRGIFNMWQHRLKADQAYVFEEAKNTSAGANDLRRHIQAIMTEGGEAYGILSEAANVEAEIWSRKSFDPKTLLVLRFAEKDGNYVAYVVGQADVASIKRNRGMVEAIPLTDAIDDLSNEPAGSSLPGRVTGTVSTFRRDRKIRDAVLKRAKGKCEYCSEFGFEMEGGGNYLEAHHIIHLSKDGADTMKNVIALCANHHRQAHFGGNAKQFEADLLNKLKSLRQC